MSINLKKILSKTTLAFVISFVLGATSISAYESVHIDFNTDFSQDFRQEEMSVIKNNISYNNIDRNIDINDIKIVGFSPKELTSDEVCEIKRVYNSTRTEGQWIQSGGKWRYRRKIELYQGKIWYNLKERMKIILARRCYKRYGDKSKTRGLEDLDEGKRYRYVPCAYCRLSQ